MSNTIPPLLCSTPPPIDFDDDNNDDFGAFESADGDFDGSSLPTTPRSKGNKHGKTQDLPIPDDVDIPVYTSDFSAEHIMSIKIEPPSLVQICNEIVGIEQLESSTDNIKKSNHDESKIIQKLQKPNDLVNDCDENLKSPTVSRMSSAGEDSPQSLELFPDNISDDENESIGDFQAAEIKYDDNTSLPSLKFDSVGISKNVTPTFDDKRSVNDIPAEFANIDENSIYSAFQSNANNENNAANEECSKYEEIEISNISDSLSELQNNIETTTNEEEEFSDFTSSNVSRVTPEVDMKNETVHESLEEIDTKEDKLSVEIVSNSSPTNIEIISTNLDENGSIKQQQNTFSEYAFEADFTQFSAFSFEVSEHEISNTIAPVNNEPLSENSEKAFNPINDNVANNQKEEDGDDFDDFQDFSTITEEEQKVQTDDEFGDFNDFRESSDDSILPINLDEKLKPILSMMFPCSEENKEHSEDLNAPRNLNDTLANELKEVDSAKALEYQWSNSNVKHSLITALGIDSRNILFGEKWNSSMPRFAANLGFNPLEPLKPAKASTSNQISSKGNLVEKHSVPKGEVPAVQFDWNSAGLVNPLDGIKEILHERKIETIHPSESCDISSTDEQQQTSSCETASTEPKISDTIQPLSDINDDLNECNKSDTFDMEKISIESPSISCSTSSSSSSVPQTSNYSMPLKETHIFTPSKTDNTIARSVKSGDSKCPIDFDYEMAAAGIIINEQVVKKEYRDIEYNPEKLAINTPTNPNEAETFANYDMKKTADGSLSLDTVKMDDDINTSDSFSEFQVGTQISATVNENRIKELTIKTDNNSSEEFSDFQFKTLSNDRNVIHFVGPAIGLSPTELPRNQQETKSHSIDFKPNLDDEFSDFQYVPPPPSIDAGITTNHRLKSSLDAKSRTNTPTLSDEMILSPAVLLPQAININSSPKINWPEPGINPDELARLEELYPTSKKSSSIETNKKLIASGGNIISPKHGSSVDQKSINNDDDDWSEFISVPASGTTSSSAINISPDSMQISKPKQNIKTTTDINDDDWSEFVSNVPASTSNSNMRSYFTPWNSSTNQLSAHYNSWNQSDFFVNPSQCSTYQQQSQNVQSISNQIVPTQKLYQNLNINNNNNSNQYSLNGHIMPSSSGSNQYNRNNLEQYHSQHQPPQQKSQRNHNQNQQYQKSPSIAVIPNLGFVSSKNFINLPKPNFTKK